MYPDITHTVSYMYMIILLINFLALIFWPVFTLWLVWCGWGENEIHVMGNFFVDTYCSTYFIGDCIRLSVSVTSLEIIPRVYGLASAHISVEHLNDVCMHIDFSWCELYWWYDEDSCLCCSRVQPVWSADLFVFETLMVVQLKSKFCIQWLLACWLSVNGVMNFPDFIRQIWHICGLQCYCSEINVTWLCTVLDWFFRALSVIMNLILNEVLCVVK